MNDKDFLLWLTNRLVYVFKVPPGTDYVTKLLSIAVATPPDRVTPNTAVFHDHTGTL